MSAHILGSGRLGSGRLGSGRAVAARVVSAVVLMVTLVVAALILSGCSAGAMAPGYEPGVASMPADGSPDREGGGGIGYAPPGGPDVSDASGDRQVARTASVTLEVPDADAAAMRVRELTASRQGYVTWESVAVRESGSSNAYSTIVVSIPSADLDAFLVDVAAVGTLRHRELTADDVTTAVVDVEARIRTLRASIERISALMERAGTVTEIAQVESELSKRQSELESLLAQQKHLSTITERASVQVSLVSTPVDTTNPFWSGLLGGWDALGASARALLVVVGAVLPFIVVLLVVGGPVLWWVRRGRRQATASAGRRDDAEGAEGAEGL